MITGVIFDIKRYTLHDGPGIRVSVHLKGCPLSCWWCHNPESQSFAPQLLFRPERCIRCGYCVPVCPARAISEKIETDELLCCISGECADVCPAGAREICGRHVTVSRVMDILLKERIFFDQSGGGVTLSGGEPLCQAGFVLPLLEECKKNDMPTAVDTSGFAGWDVIEATLPLTDLYLYDIKHMDPELHRKYTGADNGMILANLARLGEAGARINVRIPFVPGVNTDERNLRNTGEFVSRLKGVETVSLLPYHTAAEGKHRRWEMEFKLRGVYPPTSHSLAAAAGVIEKYGVKTVIGG
ncbi:MAG: glycyl-radical enzyme activating protein [Synergistaceae bacterium]|jgi:pyruvate formate lyase activating enzyme|nr:glycyl-radical enzyme activating protein [Synergistaceae bacterium]